MKIKNLSTEELIKKLSGANPKECAVIVDEIVKRKTKGENNK